MRVLAVLGLIVAWLPRVSLAQSAGEVERCFQNPGCCSGGGGGGGGTTVQAPAPPAGGGGSHATTRPAAPARTTRPCCRARTPIGGRIQESLRTLDKYNGPIDGNLQSEATIKAIQDWQKGRGTNPVGKLTPQRGAAAQRRGRKHADPARRSLGAGAPRRRRLPPPIERRCAEGPAGAAGRTAQGGRAQGQGGEHSRWSRDLKAYVAADGKGVGGRAVRRLRQVVRRHQGGRPHGRRHQAGGRGLRRRQGRRGGDGRGELRDQAGRPAPVAMPGLRLGRGQAAQEHPGLLLRRCRRRREMEDRPGAEERLALILPDGDRQEHATIPSLAPPRPGR